MNHALINRPFNPHATRHASRKRLTLWTGVASLMLASAVHAETSTLRVACDDSAENAAISINGTFKGECPIDVKVKAGTVKVKATEAPGGANQSKTINVRVGDGVVKRVEISFGTESSARTSASPQADPRAVAQLRYEAEVAEYNRNINACRPQYADALRQAKLEAKEAFEEHKAACIEFKGEWDPICGMWDAHSQKLLDRRHKAEDKAEYMDSGDDPAGRWCARQFTAPQKP